MEDKVLNTVRENLKFIPLKDLLIKPLDPIKVKKEITEQIPNGKKDKEGYNLYDTKTETKEVDSEWAIGMIIEGPTDVLEQNHLTPGMQVVYNKKFAKEFDLFKDSVLVKAYDIVAIKK